MAIGKERPVNVRYSLSFLLVLAPVLVTMAGDTLSPTKFQQKSKLRPISFTEVPREIGKLPRFSSKKPLYGLFLFGPNGEGRVWCVLDQTDAASEVYDVLYLDLDADGDLSEAGERFAATEGGDETRQSFVIGKYREPVRKDVEHSKLVIAWTPASFRYSMLWRGKRRTTGCYGSKRDLYEQLAPSPKQAPIFVPGYDRPLEFEHWMSDPIEIA